MSRRTRKKNAKLLVFSVIVAVGMAMVNIPCVENGYVKDGKGNFLS